jgi:hypothetical protein
MKMIVNNLIPDRVPIDPGGSILMVALNSCQDERERKSGEGKYIPAKPIILMNLIVPASGNLTT